MKIDYQEDDRLYTIEVPDDSKVYEIDSETYIIISSQKFEEEDTLYNNSNFRFKVIYGKPLNIDYEDISKTSILDNVYSISFCYGHPEDMSKITAISKLIKLTSDGIIKKTIVLRSYITGNPIHGLSITNMSYSDLLLTYLVSDVEDIYNKELDNIYNLFKS